MDALNITRFTDKVIEFAGNVDGIKGFNEIESDKIMRQLSELTGDNWGAVKLGGAWIISCVPNGESGTWKPVYGHQGENTRKFTKALANATGRAVVQTIPFK